jgi:monomeric sarcosine oxidase
MLGSMRERVEIAIVGGGIMGLCAAWRLAEAGHDVALFEQFALGHDRGSSHGATRIFRLAYPDPKYVRMAQRSLPLWSELGEDLISFTGGLDTGDPARVGAIASTLEACGAVVERLEPHERALRFPWLRAGELPAAFSPDTGVILASRAVAAAASRARDAGAQMIDRTPVHMIEPAEDAVTLRTESGAVEARRCIVAAGAWTAPMLARLGIRVPLRVTEESVFYFPAPADLAVAIWWDAMPWYMVPAAGGAPGMKVGEHGSGRLVDADARSGAPDEAAGQRLRERVRSALPTLDPQPVSAETCLYTTTPDEDFVIDVRGPLVVASPCSGHGFKFAPLVGETLACLASGRTPPVDIAPFRLDRFGR